MSGGDCLRCSHHYLKTLLFYNQFKINYMSADIQNQYNQLKKMLTSCGVIDTNGNANYSLLNSQRLTSGRLYDINQKSLVELNDLKAKIFNPTN